MDSGAYIPGGSCFGLDPLAQSPRPSLRQLAPSENENKILRPGLQGLITSTGMWLSLREQ